MSVQEKSWLVSCYTRDVRNLHKLMAATKNPVKLHEYRTILKQIKADMKRLYCMDYQQYRNISTDTFKLA
jgi:hypothetical protein